MIRQKLLPILAALWLAAVSASAAALDMGDPAPDFPMAGSDSKTHSMSDYRIAKGTLR